MLFDVIFPAFYFSCTHYPVTSGATFSVESRETIMLSDQEHLTTKLITMAAWWETSLK